jgi:ubiquitin fusion degradation protein 1
MSRSTRSYATDEPMTFMCTSLKTNKSICCGVVEFTADERTMFMPQWMMDNIAINDGDDIALKNVNLPKGKYIKFKPLNKEFFKLNNPKAILEHYLQNFKTLSDGSNICINYLNRNFNVQIVETVPSKAICVNNADINMDIVNSFSKEENDTKKDILKKTEGNKLYDVNKLSDVNNNYWSFKF